METGLKTGNVNRGGFVYNDYVDEYCSGRGIGANVCTSLYQEDTRLKCLCKKRCVNGSQHVGGVKITNTNAVDCSKPKEMSRTELADYIGKNCDAIKELFAYKNQDYGLVSDAYSNFRKTAERLVIPFVERCGGKATIEDAMFLVAGIYQDKHLVALSQTGLSGNEVSERLGDVANYALIMKSMKDGV